jgi:hypothetical protein
MVRAVAGDKFFDNGAQCCRRQLPMWNKHDFRRLDRESIDAASWQFMQAPPQRR